MLETNTSTVLLHGNDCTSTCMSYTVMYNASVDFYDLCHCASVHPGFITILHFNFLQAAKPIVPIFGLKHLYDKRNPNCESHDFIQALYINRV